MKRTIYILSSGLIFVILAACSSKDLYSAGQDYQREQCRIGPPSEYDECMEKADESYEDYQRNKEALENSEQ